MSAAKEPANFYGLNRILRAYSIGSSCDFKNIGRTDKPIDAITDAQYCLIVVLNSNDNGIYHATVRWYLEMHTPRDKARLYSYINHNLNIPANRRLAWRTLADIILDRLRHPAKANYGTRALISAYGLGIRPQNFDKTYRQAFFDVESELQGMLWLANDIAQQHWRKVDE